MNKIERFLHACHPRSDPNGWFSIALSYLLGQVLLIGAVQRHLLLLLFGTDNVSDVLKWHSAVSPTPAGTHFCNILVFGYPIFVFLKILCRYVRVRVSQHYGFRMYEEVAYNDRKYCWTEKTSEPDPVIQIRWTRVLAGFATSVILPSRTLLTVVMLIILCQSFYDNVTNFAAKWEKELALGNPYTKTMTGVLKTKLASVVLEKLQLRDSKQTTQEEGEVDGTSLNIMMAYEFYD